MSRLDTSGTFWTRYFELLNQETDSLTPYVCISEGKCHTGQASQHLTKAAIATRTLQRLKYGRRSSNSIRIY